jgi:hypothetical protein
MEVKNGWHDRLKYNVVILRVRLSGAVVRLFWREGSLLFAFPSHLWRVWCLGWTRDELASF